LHQAIPRGAHRYSRRFHRWVIEPAWAAVALGIFRALFPDGIIIGWRGAR